MRQLFVNLVNATVFKCVWESHSEYSQKPIQDLVKVIMTQLKDKLIQIYCCKDHELLHNSSFWRDFFNRLFLDLSSGLFDTPSHKLSKAEVWQDLISPLLKNITESTVSHQFLPHLGKQKNYMYLH